MNPKRMVLPAAIASSLIVSLVPVAHAVGPRAGCPPAFQGPLTFAQIIEMWPPPPGFPDPEGALAAYDMNADGMLCVMESPHGPTPAGPINVIDNVAAT